MTADLLPGQRYSAVVAQGVRMRAMKKVLNEVRKERWRQDAKWGVQNHPPLYWLGILGEEFGEVSKAMIEDQPRSTREELIQVAAVAVAAVECGDRMEWWREDEEAPDA